MTLDDHRIFASVFKSVRICAIMVIDTPELQKWGVL